MRRIVVMVLLLAVAGIGAGAQEEPQEEQQEPAPAAPSYRPVENPLQGEFEFAAGVPVQIGEASDDVGFDSVVLSPQGEVRSGEQVRCEFTVSGHNLANRKRKVDVVLLLEDEEGKALERLTMEAFRVRSNRAFEETQRIEASGGAVQQAKKVYIFIQIE